MKSLIKISVKLIFVLTLLAAFTYFGVKYVIPRLEMRSQDPRFHPVTQVFDGDTFEAEIDGKREKIRMLGIDTPEKWDSDKLNRDAERTGKDKNTIKILGDLASEYMKKLISGKNVRLEFDLKDDDRDRYGRLLRYAYLEDGTFINLKIVEDGYANVYRRYDVSRKNELMEAERHARENKRGLWGEIEGLKYMGEQ